MTFVHPSYLLLLVFPLFLAYWSVRRRSVGLRMPFDHEVHRSRRLMAALLKIVEILPAVLLAVAVVLVARPQVLRVPDSDRVATHITVCMDVSGSMGAFLGSRTRYESAAEAIEMFTHAREGDAIGLTLFGSMPLRWVPLTKDLQAIRNALVFANPKNQPIEMSGTMIGTALEYCAGNMQREGLQMEGSDDRPASQSQWLQKRAEEQLFNTASLRSFKQSSVSDRLLILVSDGASADLSGQDAIDRVSQTLNDAGITMYCVHIGGGSIPPAVSSIAKETGGDAFLAGNSDGLQMIFNHIDQMQPARFRQSASVPIDYFEPFAVIGAITLALYSLSLMKWRYTPW